MAICAAGTRASACRIFSKYILQAAGLLLVTVGSRGAGSGIGSPVCPGSVPGGAPLGPRGWYDPPRGRGAGLDLVSSQADAVAVAGRIRAVASIGPRTSTKRVSAENTTPVSRDTPGRSRFRSDPSGLDHRSSCGVGRVCRHHLAGETPGQHRHAADGLPGSVGPDHIECFLRP